MMKFEIADPQYVDDTARLLDLMNDIRDNLNELMPNSDGSFESDYTVEDLDYIRRMIISIAGAVDYSVFGDRCRGRFNDLRCRAEKHCNAKDVDAMKFDLRDLMMEMNDLKCVLLILKKGDHHKGELIQQKHVANLQLRISFGDESAKLALDNYFQTGFLMEGAG